MSRFGVIPTYWMRHPELTATEKAALAVLSTYADQNGYCWPSVPVLATCLCMTERHTQRALRRLEELGAVKTKRRYNEDGKPVSNGYWIRGYENKVPTVLAPDRAGDGDTDVTIDGDMQVTDMVTPMSPKHSQLKQSHVEQTPTPPPARGRPTLSFPMPEMQQAYAGFWGMAPNKPAFDATLSAVVSGMTTGKPVTIEVVGLALLEMAGNGEGFNVSRLRGYVRKHETSRETAARQSALDVPNPHGLRPEMARAVAELEAEYRAKGIPA